VYGVIAPPPKEEMPEHAEPEDERRQDSAAAVRPVERHARGHGDHADAWHDRVCAGLPLPQRQIGHLVVIARQPLGEAPVPALRATDGVRVQTVVDNANSHGRPAAWHARRSQRRDWTDELKEFYIRDAGDEAQAAQPVG